LIQDFYGQSHDDDDGQKIPLDISTKAFILFALWLPHAPQLSPIVSEIFEDHRYGCPFDYILRMNKKQTNSYPSSQDTTRITTSSSCDSMDVDYEEEPSEEYTKKYKTWCIIGEAAHLICKFYYDRGDTEKMKLWWDWSFLFRFLPMDSSTSSSSCTPGTNTATHSMESSSTSIQQLIAEINKDTSTETIQYDVVARWHGARALTNLYNLRSSTRLDYLEQLQVDEEKVPWVPYPWVIIDEETRVQEERVSGMTSILKENIFHLVISPTYEQIRNVVPLHRNLVHIGHVFSCIARRKPVIHWMIIIIIIINQQSH